MNCVEIHKKYNLCNKLQERHISLTLKKLYDIT